MGKRLIPMIVLLAVLGLPASEVRAQKTQKGEKVYEADKGPGKIDVSKYPEEMQKAYKLFAQKCGKCHTLARPINTDFADDQWNRYVKRMMNKPGSGIEPKDGEQIYKFLQYDNAARKKKPAGNSKGSK